MLSKKKTCPQTQRIALKSSKARAPHLNNGGSLREAVTRFKSEQQNPQQNAAFWRFRGSAAGWWSCSGFRSPNENRYKPLQKKPSETRIGVLLFTGGGFCLCPDWAICCSTAPAVPYGFFPPLCQRQIKPVRFVFHSAPETVSLGAQSFSVAG